MKIKYKNTVDDLIELNFYLNTKLKNRRVKNYFLKYGYMLIILLISIWYFKYNYEDKYIFLIIVTILCLLWLVLLPIIVKMELRHRLKDKDSNNKYLYNETILKLKNDKIVILKNDNKSELSFKDIPIIVKKELRYRFRDKDINNKYLYNETILKLKKDKIVILKNDNKSELSFKDISNIIIYKKRIFIFKENFNIFAIVPVKVFLNDSEKNKFLNIIKGNLC